MSSSEMDALLSISADKLRKKLQLSQSKTNVPATRNIHNQFPKPNYRGLATDADEMVPRSDYFGQSEIEETLQSEGSGESDF